VSSIPQPLPPTSFASPLTQQQVMNAMGSLNLLPQQPPISQPPNLLPLIQKLLSGDFLTNRTPIIDEKLGMDQGSRPHQMQQTGTSLALNQVRLSLTRYFHTLTVTHLLIFIKKSGKHLLRQGQKPVGSSSNWQGQQRYLTLTVFLAQVKFRTI
jgi:hypothetical protein